MTTADAKAQLVSQIAEQGVKIRELRAQNAAKELIDVETSALKKLQEQLKGLSVNGGAQDSGKKFNLKTPKVCYV